MTKDNDSRKKACPIVNFTVPADHWLWLKSSEKRHIYLELAKKKKMERESDGDTNCTLGAVTKELKKELKT